MGCNSAFYKEGPAPKVIVYFKGYIKAIQYVNAKYQDQAMYAAEKIN